MNAWSIGAGVVGVGALAFGVTNAVKLDTTGSDEGITWGQALSVMVPIGIGLGVLVGGGLGAREWAREGASHFFGSRGEIMGRYGVVGAIAGAGVGGMIAGPGSTFV